MALFQPRTRVEILREMVARTVGRSDLVGLAEDSAVFHGLAAAANEDAEQYVQMARLRALFSIDDATGSDLDKRAEEIQPGRIKRFSPLFASTSLRFGRSETSGTKNIPIGTLAGAKDEQGTITYRTTAAGSIADGNSESGLIPAVATIAGSRANVSAGDIKILVSRLTGVNTVSNPADVNNGRDRESDESFRSRLKDYVQSLSRGTPTALQFFATGVLTRDGRRALFAKLVEPTTPTGRIVLYVDDGTGFIETYSDVFLDSPDTIMDSTTGGEKELTTTERPIRDDGSFVLEIDTGGGFVEQERGVDYFLNAPLGQVDLSEDSFPTGLPVGAEAQASYRHYTGLIQTIQKVIDGVPSDRARRPGVRSGGVQCVVKAPKVVFQQISAQYTVRDGFVPSEVESEVRAAIQAYINDLDIGENVIAAEITERAMAVSGMFNFRITNLSGSAPPVSDQIVLSDQVARILAKDISLV